MAGGGGLTAICRRRMAWMWFGGEDSHAIDGKRFVTVQQAKRKQPTFYIPRWQVVDGVLWGGGFSALALRWNKLGTSVKREAWGLQWAIAPCCP